MCVVRVDQDASGFKQKKAADRLKVVNESIKLCLDNQVEFTGDVIREALSRLLQDETPAQTLMRTAILSFNTAVSGGEVKKFVLTELIPTLVRRKTWVSAPKVWDGVVYLMNIKTLSTNKDTDMSVLSVLSMPVGPLRALIKAAPNAKIMFTRCLRSLSAEALERVVSGEYAGLHTEAITASESIATVACAAVGDATAVGVAEDTNSMVVDAEATTTAVTVTVVVDPLKRKLITELLGTQ